MSNKFKILFSILVGVFSLSGAAKAATISPVVVGGLDIYIGWCNGVPSGDADEVLCINAEAGISITTSDIDKVEGGDLDIHDVDGMPGVVAQLLPVGFRGDYFLLKTGNLTPGPGGSTQVFYIFMNNESDDYAVVDLNNVSFPYPFANSGQISHFTGIASVAPVPLPAAAWMFMGAIGGMLGFRKISLRRRKLG